MELVAQNRIWCAIVALALELTAWLQLLALTDHDARRWEPRRLRHRFYTIPTALVRGGRRTRLRYARHPLGHAARNSAPRSGHARPLTSRREMRRHKQKHPGESRKPRVRSARRVTATPTRQNQTRTTVTAGHNDHVDEA